MTARRPKKPEHSRCEQLTQPRGAWLASGPPVVSWVLHPELAGGVCSLLGGASGSDPDAWHRVGVGVCMMGARLEKRRYCHGNQPDTTPSFSSPLHIMLGYNMEPEEGRHCPRLSFWTPRRKGLGGLSKAHKEDAAADTLALFPPGALEDRPLCSESSAPSMGLAQRSSEKVH